MDSTSDPHVQSAKAIEPSIAVVIPAYRAEKTICRAIGSALSQPGVRTNVIVVIDGDLDDTQEKLRQYPVDQVTVMVNPVNLGAAGSRNKGLSAVRSEFVMFLDADDFLEGPLLQQLVRKMCQETADLGFAPMQILHERDGRREKKVTPSFTSHEDAFAKWQLDGIYVTPCSVLWRTEFVRSIGGWDAELRKNDDGELNMRAILLGARFVQSADGCGIYVKHSLDSLNNRTDNLASLLVANDKLLALDSPMMPKERQREICAGHYFNVAWQCYLAGREDLGNEALVKSRSIGFGARGPWHYRILFRLLGVRRTWRLARVIKRRLAW